MMARDAELEGLPFGVAGERAAPPPDAPSPAPAPAPIRIPPPDWEQEERERRTRVAETFFSEDVESYPAKPRRSKEAEPVLIVGQLLDGEGFCCRTRVVAARHPGRTFDGCNVHTLERVELRSAQPQVRINLGHDHARESLAARGGASAR